MGYTNPAASSTTAPTMASPIMSQHVHITTPDLRAISQPAHMDPDISATLSDFLTYTEHLPSSVVRSLTLIAAQDRLASRMQQNIHRLLTTYTILPTLKVKGKDAPDPAQLRKDISHAYDRLESARRMSAAESTRMAELVESDRIRLATVSRKLKAMPMPPSRDATPEPVASPGLRKKATPEKRTTSHRTGQAARVRGRKIMVPGEVLPPPNPDSPPMSEPSVWASPRPSSPLEPRARKKSVGREKTPKPQRPPKDMDRTPKPARSRAPGMPGTNAHSAVAGISTSNALLALVPPPPDARPGSSWLPWKRITEFELARLRKRMKKNAIWLPSPAMRNRELKNLGRGQQAMDQAKADAGSAGEHFLDEYDHIWSDPTKAVMTGEEKAEMTAMLGPEIDQGGDEDDELMNRGMRLNEAKKRKRERQLEELAVQAQLDAEQGIKTEPVATSNTTQKKRKRDTTPARAGNNITNFDSPDPITRARPGPLPKRLKLSLPGHTTANSPASAGNTIKIPLVASPLTSSNSLKARSRRASVAPEAATRPRSTTSITIKPSKAASAEPPARRISLRRSSNASLPDPMLADAPAPTTTGRSRRKRPAPGLITADEDGSTKVSVGKRKAAPKKKSIAAGGQQVAKAATPSPLAPVVEDEAVDPNEPRYCVCGDVSWGTMIACDNDDCDKEWFHLDCVNLQEMPPRRTKWYCPDCRKKLKIGQSSNGIVR